jgi:hypothetical protein
MMLNCLPVMIGHLIGARPLCLKPTQLVEAGLALALVEVGTGTARGGRELARTIYLKLPQIVLTWKVTRAKLVKFS